MAEELTALTVFFDDKFAQFQDRMVRILRFMNQSTDLVAIETMVKELKDEIEAHRKEAMLPSDAPITANPPQPRIVAVSPELAEALANPPRPERVQISAERVPIEYWNEFPAELQRRLRGLKKTEEIVSEINSFQIEEVNQRNQEAMAAQLAAIPRQPRPLPRYVRPEYLPAEWREEMPEALRKRLERVRRPEYVVGEIRQYQLGEQNKRWSEEARKLMHQDFEPGVPPPQSGPPVQIQIIHQRTATP